MGEDKDFEGTSVCTLIPMKNSSVNSYATYITEEELKLIDTWEGDEYT